MFLLDDRFHIGCQVAKSNAVQLSGAPTNSPWLRPDDPKTLLRKQRRDRVIVLRAPAHRGKDHQKGTFSFGKNLHDRTVRRLHQIGIRSLRCVPGEGRK